MQDASPFALLAQEYDQWFERHPDLFAAELACLQGLIPPFQKAVEIGVGTGRFAQGLGIPLGLDREPAMLALAQGRGIECHQGTAELLPWPDEGFDLVLLVTLLCFVAEPALVLAETHRVLRPQGHVLVAFLNPDSPAGQALQAEAGQNPFYRHAQLRHPHEVVQFLRAAGFTLVQSAHCLRGDAAEPEFLQVHSGLGPGLFTALLATKIPPPR